MRVRRRLARAYGAGPLHLLGVLGAFAVAGYAAVRLVPDDPRRVILWFVGAAVLHDLVLLPLYSLVDRAARAGPSRRVPLPWVNHLRVPAFLSGLLLLVWFPLIFRFPSGFEAITATFFVGSAAVYGLRLTRVTRRASSVRRENP